MVIVFFCLQRGHRAANCTSAYLCSVCKGRHHVSFCDGPKEEAGPSESSVSPTLHLGVHSSVALQTARAFVDFEDRKGKVKVRVLFHLGSQLSFVTSTIVNQLGLEPKRKEWLEISTFGQIQ